MVKLKKLRGRWLITLDHWVMNLLSTNSHMDLTSKLFEVDLSIIQLLRDKGICFNALRAELNWSYWTLIALVHLWTSRIWYLLDFLFFFFLNLTWHWVCLLDGNISASPNLRLDYVRIFKVPFTRISSHILMDREAILSMLLFIHVFDTLVTVKYQLIFDNVHCWESFSLYFGWSGSLSRISICSVTVSTNPLSCLSSVILKSNWQLR